MTHQPGDYASKPTGAERSDNPDAAGVAQPGAPRRQGNDRPRAARVTQSSATRAHPVYLARAGYRSRRLMDAARLLPVTGMFLLILPMLWQPVDTDVPGTARHAGYLFGIWAALIVVAAILSRKLSRIMRNADPPEG